MCFRVPRKGEDRWVGYFTLEIKSLVLRRHSEQWCTLDFNPRSNLLLAAGCEDCNARMFDTESGLQVVSFDSHQGALTGIKVCLLNSVPYLISSALDGSIFLWNLTVLTGPARPYSGHAKVEKRPLKAVSSLDLPMSCIAVAEVFGALRVFAGCHDATAWMWTIEAKAVIDQQTWYASDHVQNIFAHIP